ncbi:MAG: glutamate-cysteine ligase family protein [Acidimicrobiia bacterium]
MPPLDTHIEPLGLGDVERIVADSLFPDHDGVHRIGIEIEAFPIAVEHRVTRRVAIAESTEVLAEAGFLADEQPDPRFLPHGGGALTFEPGGQIEHSSAPHPIVCDAIREALAVRDDVAAAYAERGIRLVFTGTDHWHDVDSVPQQLTAPRYRAMARYFGKRGPWGGVMMRHTSSLQVNLEAGTGAVARERWSLANLVSPLLTATFSTSPVGGDHCRRALAWRRLDPTRTGFPAGVLRGEGNPSDQITQFALDADVLVVMRDEGTVTGTPGWSFRRWLAEPHPDAGPPSAADLEYHLTTLFPEVRLRSGLLEFRACDSLPPRWQPVPIVLLAGLLYDEAARQEALDLLEPYGEITAMLWAAAAVRGLRDRTVASLTDRIWDLALEGSRRLGPVFIGPKQEIAEEFVAAYPGQRRAPGDDLRKLLADDPRTALEWAAG